MQTKGSKYTIFGTHHQALSPSEFVRILNCEYVQEAWQILETTYEGSKIVKSAKLQMLISKFEEIKMMDDEAFSEFYTRISDLRNSMLSDWKRVSDVKLIKKILKPLPEHFRIEVTIIEESKDLDFVLATFRMTKTLYVIVAIKIGLSVLFRIFKLYRQCLFQAMCLVTSF
jgi:hypothetical protein